MKLIYIKPNNSSFIRGDEQILAGMFPLKSILLFQAKGNVHYFLNQLKMCFLLLWTGLTQRRALFVCWFGDYHAALMVFLGKITRSKTVIFIGGQETVCYHELGKGIYRNKFRAFFVRYALRNASLIISNHPSLIYHENFYYNQKEPHIDGVKHYVPGFKTPVSYLNNGIDGRRFVRDVNIPKIENKVLTVGTMSHLGDFKNKGFDMFIEVAARNIQWQFVLIGLHPAYLNWVEENYQVSKISNLTIIPTFCPLEVLMENYNQAKVFVQASITEGMPNTLSEAMLLECIPVGSNINGIPDAIGDTGVVVKHRKVEEIEEAIALAMQMNSGHKARERVLEHFSFEQREASLLQIIGELY